MPALDTTWLVDFAKQLNNVSLLSSLLPAFIGVWRWHSLARPLRGLVWFTLISGCLLGLLAEVGRVVWHNNVLIIYLSIWAETIFLYWVFNQSIRGSRARSLLLAGFSAFVVVAAAECIFWGGPFGAKTYTRIVQSIFLVGAALLYFEQVLLELRNIKLHKDPLFLASVGITLYYAGALMVFVLEDSMQQHRQMSQIWIMYIIQFALLIVLNFLFTLALWNASQPKPLPGKVQLS